jgi:hypothetical protein
MPGPLVRQPDVFLVVLDGYPGQLALGREFAVSSESLIEQLTSRGFRMPNASWAAYSMTHASVPSLLDMSYPVDDGTVLTLEDETQLYRMIGGDNQLVRTLRAHGYRFTMIEAGWGGSRCGPEVDSCIPGPFIDDSVEAILDASLLKPVVDQLIGNYLTHGARHTMSWLVQNGRGIAENGQPDLVFAHVLAPHPPALLDASCDLQYRSELDSKTFVANVDRRQQRDAFLEQLGCVNRFMLDFVASIPEDDVIVFASDHGTDSRLQLLRDPAVWSYEDLLERLNVFVAWRLPSGCSDTDPLVVPNVMRVVLSCMGKQPLPHLEPRMFALVIRWADLPVRELDASTVGRLLAERAES